MWLALQKHSRENEQTVQRMSELAKSYNKKVLEEDATTAEKREVANVRPAPCRARGQKPDTSLRIRASGLRLACSRRHAFPRPNPQVGKLDPKRHLEKDIDLVMSANIIQTLGTMLDTVVF